VFLVVFYFPVLKALNSVLVLTIIVAMSVVMVVVGIVTKTIAIVVNALGLLPVAESMKNVVQGLHLKRRNMMIEGLQGTMITGEEAMMTADHLIIMMIVAGMTMTGNATIEDVKTKKTAMRIGLQDPRMVVKDGVEELVSDV